MKTKNTINLSATETILCELILLMLDVKMYFINKG